MISGGPADSARSPRRRRPVPPAHAPPPPRAPVLACVGRVGLHECGGRAAGALARAWEGRPSLIPAGSRPQPAAARRSRCRCRRSTHQPPPPRPPGRDRNQGP
jgi:hypothetical protein